MRYLLGHLNCILLLRRELLGVLSYCYEFDGRYAEGRARAWPSTAAEIRRAWSLLPAAQSKCTRPWYGEVAAVDACLSGIGFVRRPFHQRLLESLGG